MKNSFFQALDIIYFWADAEKLPVSISRYEICVSCATDLSPDAKKVCHFISFILKQRWNYLTVRENDEYKIFFYASCEKNPTVQTDLSNHKKRKGTAKVPKTNKTNTPNTLFD